MQLDQSDTLLDQPRIQFDLPLVEDLTEHSKINSNALFSICRVLQICDYTVLWCSLEHT